MTTAGLVAMAAAMLAAIAVLLVADHVAARLHRELPFCMEHDPAACWADHQAGQCVCAPADLTDITDIDTIEGNR